MLKRSSLRRRRVSAAKLNESEFWLKTNFFFQERNQSAEPTSVTVYKASYEIKSNNQDNSFDPGKPYNLKVRLRSITVEIDSMLGFDYRSKL